MDIIRLATVEEVADKQEVADIVPHSTVVTFGGKDMAVVRDVREIDFLFDEASTNQRKMLFLMNMETALRLQGTTELYFSIPAEDSAYLDVMKHWGAEQIKSIPVIRMKKVL